LQDGQNRVLLAFLDREKIAENPIEEEPGRTWSKSMASMLWVIRKMVRLEISEKMENPMTKYRVTFRIWVSSAIAWVSGFDTDVSSVVLGA
jgi:hypothetical protein